MPSKARIADTLKYFDPAAYRRVVAQILNADREMAAVRIETALANLENARHRLAMSEAECAEFDAEAPTNPARKPRATDTHDTDGFGPISARTPLAPEFLPPITKPAANGHLFTDRESNRSAY